MASNRAQFFFLILHASVHDFAMKRSLVQALNGFRANFRKRARFSQKGLRKFRELGGVGLSEELDPCMETQGGVLQLQKLAGFVLALIASEVSGYGKHNWCEMTSKPKSCP